MEEPKVTTQESDKVLKIKEDVPFMVTAGLSGIASFSLGIYGVYKLFKRTKKGKK